jgi:hypothetical protein
MNDSNPVALGYEIYKQLTNPWDLQYVRNDFGSQLMIAQNSPEKN